MVGNILITFALLASVFSITMYYFTYKGYDNALKLARAAYHATSISIIGASAYLMYAILNHQYEFKYVYDYSNSDLSVGMLMSTFWAGQQGSFLLWLLLTALSGLALLEYTSKRGNLESRVMMVFTLAVTFLLIMVSPGLKNPFTLIWSDPTYIDLKNISQSFMSLPFINDFLFTDQSSGASLVLINEKLAGLLASNGISINDFIQFGKGLNPLLNNFWMQIHPPILFVGFAMSTVPFSFAFAALISNDYKDWVTSSLPWLLGGMMVLGLAIMLGGYWAYVILGWGGYWGWDPVENSSLVPWIVGVAGIHTMLIQKRTQTKEHAGRFVKTNLILSILTYLLVLYSTFLTRSGILGDASVHSFVSPGMVTYALLLIFISTFTILGFGAIIYRWKYLEKTFTSEENILSRELALFVGAVLLLGSAAIIIAGTSMPIFGSAVEISFYNEMILPIAILLGILNGLSLLINWKKTSEKTLIDNLKIPLFVTFILTVVAVVWGGFNDIMAIIFMFSALFSMVINTKTIYKIVKNNISYIGGYVAHLGFAFFMLGVIGTGWFTTEKQVELIQGETKSALGYDFTFTGYTPVDNGKKYKFNVNVVKDGSENTLSPVMYVSDFNQSLMRDPDLLNLITKDLYLSPVSYEDAKEASGGEHNHQTTLIKGEPFEFHGSNITFTKFNFPQDAMNSMQSGADFFIGAVIEILHDGKTYTIEPKMKSSSGVKTFEDAVVEGTNLKIELKNLDASGKIEVVINELSKTDEPTKEVQVAKGASLWVDISVKPFINLIWVGTLTIVLGFFISMVRRTKEAK
ncbi:MAG: cytochrome C biogenesis protein [Ignavibacteriales bacterium CG18_big_fil_WC_8_21_14_2_50_31_20]|nr:MAG: cytochrome C biogenesis protein [Ignavibacteriales bacterium CG18_big_fil_WC_8_21_14_2_50_31_20]